MRIPPYSKNPLVSSSILLSLLLITSCKENVDPEKYVRSTDAMTIFDVEANSISFLATQKNGDFKVGFTKDLNFRYAQPGIAILDNTGRLKSVSSYGGSLDELISSGTIGEDGMTYVCGRTNSPELRMDAFSSVVSTNDAFLAKLDPSGRVVWQRGYSDTSAGNKGRFEDDFETVIVQGDSIYCFGSTENYQNLTPRQYRVRDTWMAVFDTDGNVHRRAVLPGLPYVDITQWQGAVSRVAQQMKNKDIIVFSSAWENFGAPRTFDTTCVMMRIRPSTGEVLWTKYFKDGSPEGDIVQLVELADGRLLCLNSYISKVVILNGSDGAVISSSAFDRTVVGSNAEWKYFATMRSVEDKIYLLGNISTGETIVNSRSGLHLKFHGAKPWLLRMDATGKVEYSKIYDIPEANFIDFTINENGNLAMLGSISKFSDQTVSGMLITLTTDGDIITP